MYWATSSASTGLITPLSSGPTFLERRLGDGQRHQRDDCCRHREYHLRRIDHQQPAIRRISATAGYNVSLAGGTNTINSGGILIAQSVGGYGPTEISSAGGSLTSANGDLVVNNFNPVTNFTISAPVVGGIGLTAAGTGNTIISGANTYSGVTNVSTIGTAYLLAQTPASLPGFSTPGLVVVNTGLLAVGTTDPTSPWTAANIDTLRANATFAPGTSLAIDVGATPFTYASNVSGVLGLAKIDTGTLTLTGSSTYTGATSVYGGTLSVGTLAASGSSSPIGSGSSIVLGTGGTLQYTGATTGINRNVTLAFNGGVFNLTNGLTLTGNVSGPGGLTLTNGNLTLSGTNGYAGPTAVLGGQLTFSAAAAIPAGTTLSIAPGATAAFGAGVAPNVAALVGSGTLNIGSSTTLTVGGDQASGTYSGVLANGSGGATTLVKTGAGTQVLTAANTYTGATNVNGGTLQISPLANGVNPLMPARSRWVALVARTRRHSRFARSLRFRPAATTRTLSGMPAKEMRPSSAQKSPRLPSTVTRSFSQTTSPEPVHRFSAGCRRLER